MLRIIDILDQLKVSVINITKLINHDEATRKGDVNTPITKATQMGR